ncbi:MAG: class I adenylate-forming enzyme family protein [Haloarculaceae archaeon]
MDPVPAEELLCEPYDGSIANLLTRTVETFPDRVAIEHAGEARTYAEFGSRVRRLAGGLHEMGLAPDDRVVVHLPNGVPYAETIWGCVHAGVVASPSNPQYRRRELEYQLDHSDARAVVTSGEGEEHAAPVAEDLGLDVISTDPESEYTTLDDLVERGEPTLVERGDDDVMLQLYTSGTTGKPKGVLHTHRNYRVQLVQSIASYTAGPVRGDELIVLPMFHLTGNNQMLVALTTGRTVRVLRPDEWNPERVLDAIDAHDVPMFVGVATMFVDLLETYKADPDRWDVSTFQRAAQGGTKLPEPVHEEFEAVLDVSVSEGYGSTETTAATHTVGASTLGDKIGSVGQPIGHVRSKLVDPETGEEVGTGEEGELLVKSPQVMKGYYKNPDANEEAFTDDGWFRTGDIAERDEDNYYYIKGREKEMILTGGYNVYPAEVEQTLYDHPEIQEAAVVGVPDERKGETVAAAVSLVEGSDLSPDDVREYVLDELAPYKHPRVVEIVDELPTTGSGKVRKVDVKDRLAERRD